MYTKGIVCEKIVLANPAALLLTACDRKSTDAFARQMASFSNEFQLIPCAAGERFSQTLLDEHDVVVKKVSAQLSREGCSIC